MLNDFKSLSIKVSLDDSCVDTFQADDIQLIQKACLLGLDYILILCRHCHVLACYCWISVVFFLVIRAALPLSDDCSCSETSLCQMWRLTKRNTQLFAFKKVHLSTNI